MIVTVCPARPEYATRAETDIVMDAFRAPALAPLNARMCLQAKTETEVPGESWAQANGLKGWQRYGPVDVLLNHEPYAAGADNLDRHLDYHDIPDEWVGRAAMSVTAMQDANPQGINGLWGAGLTSPRKMHTTEQLWWFAGKYKPAFDASDYIWQPCYLNRSTHGRLERIKDEFVRSFELLDAVAPYKPRVYCANCYWNGPHEATDEGSLRLVFDLINAHRRAGDVLCLWGFARTTAEATETAKRYTELAPILVKRFAE